MKLLRCVVLAASVVLPCVVNCLLISRKGLLILALTLLIEVGLLFVRRLLEISRRMNVVHDWVQQILSVAGIVIGISLYPVQSSPPALELAAVGFAALVHFITYMIMSGIIFNG